MLTNAPLRRLAVAALILLAGCSGDDGDAAAVATDPPSSASTSPRRATSTTTIPNGLAPAVGLGETQATPAGNEVTVFAVEHPVTPDHALSDQPDEDAVLAAVDAQFCAAAGTDVRAVSEVDFFVLTSDGRQRGRWNEDDYARNPRFPLSMTVADGECVRGWVTFELEDDEDIALLRWDTNGNGSGPFLDWRV